MAVGPPFHTATNQTLTTPRFGFATTSFTCTCIPVRPAAAIWSDNAHQIHSLEVLSGPGTMTPTTTVTSTKAQAKPEQNDFFWAYTEEPHRSRRMAIIKAHPEVALPFCCVYLLAYRCPSGDQAMRSGAVDKVSRPRRCPPSSSLRVSPERHISSFLAVHPHGIRNWRNVKPESIPCDTRNLS